MNHEVVAKDRGGVRRCYGLGRDGHEALRQCKIACLDYMRSRPDIDILYLFVGDSDKPIIDCRSRAGHSIQQMAVKAE